MKEFNLIALLGFYLFCPQDAKAIQGHEFLNGHTIEFKSEPQNWQNVYFLSQKTTLTKTADVQTRAVEPTSKRIFSNSKPVIQRGKRFLRPKILF
jgi:hypothetical protein